MKPFKLYGMPASLYTGKVRAYLRKHKIPFVEYGMNHPDFQGRIVPAVGRVIVPVIETPDGTIVQDGADILEFLDRNGWGSFSIYPEDPRLLSIAYLFELFGGEGLLRPAMHYRWNFNEENLDFIRDEFICALAPVGGDTAEAEGIFDFASQRMRKAAADLGVTPESIPLIEQSYEQFLSLFNAHLEKHSYLLGGQPTVGDYGLFSALYAHLARDPAPALLMRQVAPRVGRWVERMNSPESAWVEYPEDESLISAENIPNTLKALMGYVAEEYLEEISAHVQFANQWIADHPTLKAGEIGLEKPGGRFIGTASFAWRGIKLETTVMPYRFYLLQRVQDCLFSVDKSMRDSITQQFKENGLEQLLELRTQRRVKRSNHLEYWGELIPETKTAIGS